MINWKLTALAILAVTGLASGTAQAANCGDPWVTQLTTKYLHHAPSSPNAPQCNIYLYRNGQWNNFAELDAAVDGYYAVNGDPDTQAAIAPGAQGNGSNIYRNSYGQLVDRNTNRVISNDGGSLVGNAGGTLVGPSGGTRPNGGN